MKRSDTALVCCLLLAVAARWAGWSQVSADMAHFLIPWTTELAAAGFQGVATTSSNYNPPYLYLLWLGTVVDPGGNPVTIVKATSTLFDVALAATVAQAVRQHAAPHCWMPPRLAFGVTLVLPTVVASSAVWGQCDVIYTCFLLLAILAAERGHTQGFAAGYATALAFKLQAAFSGPAALACWLALRARAKAVAVLTALAIYVVWLVPSVLAGRGWQNALTVYFRQAASTSELALGAPNLWTAARYVLKGPSGYTAGLVAGLGLTLIFLALWIPFARKRLRQGPDHLMTVAFTTAFMLPFLLPKMHDRYFFPADILAWVLAARSRRWLPVAALVQLGSVTAYAAYLSDAPGWLVRPAGIAANCVVIVLLARHWRAVWRADRQAAQAVS